MFGFYDIDELTIGQMSVVNKTESIYDCISIDDKFILKKIPGLCNSWQYNYEEVFTGNKYRVKNREVVENEIVLEEAFDISEYLTKKELKFGKVSKHRLYQISKIINCKDKKIDNVHNKRKHLSLHHV